MIDHHPYPQQFTELMISHPEYSSTAELIFHVVKAMGYEKYIDKSSAEAIYCGVMTDTGSFDYNISDPQTFQTVSELLTWGIDPEAIHGKVFDNYSADRMRLLGHCLSECMEVYPEYHSAMMYLSREVQQKYNFLAGDNEGFVNYPLSIKGIHFSAFFTEKEDHVKVSFRSKGEFAVNELASSHFNGGGHRNASGGEIYAPLEEVLERFRKLLPEYRAILKKTRI
jgi:phosphoesterase RecJ-like protein